MKLWVKLYLIIVTLLLIMAVGVVLLNVFIFKSVETENPNTLGNIVLTARIVKPERLNADLQMPEGDNPKRTPKSGLYLVTRAWIKSPAKSVLAIYAEFETPKALQGRKVRIDGSFFEETHYDVQPIKLLGDNFTDEQINEMLSQPATLKLTKVAVK